MQNQPACTPPTLNFLMVSQSPREKHVYLLTWRATVCTFWGVTAKKGYSSNATPAFPGNSWLKFTEPLSWLFTLLVSVKLLIINSQIRVGKHTGASPDIDFQVGHPSEINGELCLKTNGTIRATFLKQKEATNPI